uniref:Uncharacterized protein n=1 Tax=Davidia involucrata TaxID=16924 RepID=A0A5B6Z8I5_DAVIN
MAKRTREYDSDGTAATTAYNTVFIDTSLETHLAMIVSDADTVADLKKKITFEHPQCFPKIGEIKIHALKVKRKGYFYHLSDSMLVKSAFEGAKKNWFVSVDASSLKENKENLHSRKHDAGDQLALLCTTNYPSGDRNNLLPGSPSNKLSIIDESLLPQPGSIQHANLKVPNADQSDLVNPCKEVSKDLEMEIKHTTVDYCKNSSSAPKRSDLDIQDKYNLLSEENKVPGAKGKVDKSRDGIDDVQCNSSREGSLKIVCAEKKKRKKNNGDVVCGHASEDNHASFYSSSKDTLHPEIVGPENSSGNAGREISNDMMVGNTGINKETCETSSYDTNKRSDSGTHRKYDVCEGTEVPGTNVGYKNDKSKNRICDAQCNNSLEEAAQSGPTARKKHKIESQEGTGNPFTENKALVFNSDKETSKPETTIRKKSIEDKQKGRNATSDSLFTELPEDVLLINSSSSKKRKKKGKKKSSASHDQLVSAVPSSLHDVGEENFKEHEEINPKESGGVSDSAAVPEESIQHGTLSKHLGISQKEKHSEPVQGVVDGNKVPCSSIGINMSEPDSGTVKGKEDAPELAAGFGLKGTKYSKKHHANDVKGVPSLPVRELDSIKKDVAQSGHENLVPGYHNVETIQTEKIEEEKELSRDHDSEVMLSEKCKPLDLSEADMNIKKTIISAKLSDANIVMESGSSAAKRRKTKRANKSVAGEQFTSDISSTVPYSTLNDCSSSEAKKDESNLSKTERSKVSKPNKVDPSFMVADGEGDSVNGNEAESLMPTQIYKSQENAENMDEKSKKKSKKNRSSTAMTLPDLPIKEQGNEMESMQLSQSNKLQETAENVDGKLRKKTKKNQNSTAKSLPDLPIKEQEVGAEELTSSNDRMREVDTSSKRTKKTRSVKTSALNQSAGSESELEKNIGTECGSFHPQQISLTVFPSQVPSSQSLESNSKGRVPEANVICDALKNGCIDDANNHMEDSMCEGDKIDFRDYFVTTRHQHEVAPAEVLVDKVNKAKGSDGKLKNNTEKPVPAVRTSPDRKSHGRNSCSIQLQESLPKDERNDVMLHFNKKSSKVSRNGGKALHSQDIDQIKSISQEARQPDIFNGSRTNSPAPAYLKKNSESSASSSSSSKSSDKSEQKRRHNGHQSSLNRRVTLAKASSKNNGEVVTRSKHEKSLLATPGAIFRDGSSESSDSDASTRTPSDNSSFSGHSEGESKSSLQSPRNGSHGAKGKEGDGKNIKKSISTGPKNITMDMIFRSSSRFKKAKVTASQSQPEDT